jgi:hypothetical protein
MRRMLVVTAVALLAARSGASAAAPSHRVDLITGTVDGQTVLGSTVAQAIAALGRPDFRTGNRNVLQRIGWGKPGDFTYEVIFRRHGAKLHAQTVVFEAGTVVDVKAGSLLSQTPTQLRSTIRNRYGNALEVARRLVCKRGTCTGEFRAADTSVHLTFGSTIANGTFVSIWKPFV